MQQLLRIEWLKLKNYAAFKILGIFFIIGVFLVNFIVFRSVQNFTENVSASQLVGTFRPYAFAYTWQTTAYVTGYLLILPAMLMVILVTNEFSFRTNRQNIIDGWSRQQFIDVKIAMAFIFAAIATLLVAITALLFGLLSGDSFSVNKLESLGYFFLKAVSYNMVAVLLSTLIRKTGFAIGVFFIYLGAENIISQMLDFWSIKLRADNKMDLGSIGDYLPMNASDGLLSFPDNPLKSMAKQAMPSDYTWLVAALAITYLVLFIMWSRKRIIKSDL